MKLRLRTIMALGLGLILVGGVGFRIMLGVPQGPASALVPMGRVPDFRLTDRSGKALSLSDLKGKVWVADFVFTSCSGTCPMMTQRMSELEKALHGLPRLHFVSFSVDPERDTPEKLRRYADIYTKEKETWHFLTGKKEVIYSISNRAFHLAASEVPTAERTPGEGTVIHSEKFVLVDGEGQIRGYYSGTDPESLEGLRRDVRRLLIDPCIENAMATRAKNSQIQP